MCGLATDHIELVCDRDSFVPRRDSRVRWLDWDADYPLAKRAWAEVGLALTIEDWHNARDSGYTYCGIVEDGVLVSVAAVWTYSDRAWEVAAVRTNADHRCRGLATAVVSFVTEHILSNGRLATCHTGRDNRAMQKTAQAVGFMVVTK